MKLYLGDCLEVMKDIPDASVDMVLADLPYGTTVCKWDTQIPLNALWDEYVRIIKATGAVLLFGQEPFASTLRLSQPDLYKYDWYWKKNKSAGFVHAKNKPLNYIETISVFSKSPIGHAVQLGERRMGYNPQGVKPGTTVLTDRKAQNAKSEHKYVRDSHADTYQYQGEGYPKTLIEFGNPTQGERLHPTQKPVDLLEYLIKTYTQEGETVLDNTMGSGSTGVACVNTGRKFIGIEKEPKYFEIAEKRIFTSFPPAVKQYAVEKKDGSTST